MGRLRVTAMLVGLVMVASACGWTQTGYDAGRSENNSLERIIDVSNVANLTPGWSTGDEGFSGAPVEFGGNVFLQDATHVRALSAATGHALWSAPLTPTTDKTTVEPVGVAFARLEDGRSFVISADSAITSISTMPGGPRNIGGMLAAYDAATGAPIWSQQIGPHSAPLIVGSTVFVTSYQSGFSGPTFVGLVALDLATGAIKFRAKIDEIADTLAATNNQLIVVPTGFGFQAVAAGGCGAAMCPVAWAGVGGGRIPGDIAVSGGVIYTASYRGIEAYDAQGCGASECAPTWRAPGDFDQLAIGHGLVFVGASLSSLIPTTLQAFRSDGCGSETCSPVWTSSESAAFTQPFVANGVVYSGAIDGSLRAWPAAGCGAATCSAIFSVTLPDAVMEPIVADGRLYVSEKSLRTYILPRG